MIKNDIKYAVKDIKVWWHYNRLKLWSNVQLITYLSWNDLGAFFQIGKLLITLIGIAGIIFFGFWGAWQPFSGLRLVGLLFSAVLGTIAFLSYRNPPMSKIKIVREGDINKDSKFIKFENIKPSNDEEKEGWKTVSTVFDINALVNEKFDNYLFTAPEIKVRISKEKLQGVPAKLEDGKKKKDQLDFLKAVVSGKNITTNDKKVILDTPLIIPLSDDAKLIESNYFNSIITTDSADAILISGSKYEPLDKNEIDMTVYYPCDQAADSDVFRLSSHPISGVSGHLGGSTIAITSDGYVIIFLQRSDQLISAGKIMPSGSGSMDWSDVTDIAKESGNRESIDIRDLVKRNVVRELVEETRLFSVYSKNAKQKILKDEAVSLVEKSTKVVGMFRPLDRMGKPDFVAITKLEFKLTQIEADGVEVAKASENLMPKTKIEGMAGFAKLRKKIIDFNTLRPHPKLKMSSSLEMCFQRIIQIAEYKDSKDKEKRKIYEEVNSLLFG